MIDLQAVFGYDNGGGKPDAAAPIKAVEVIDQTDDSDQPRDLGAYVRTHGEYPPGGLVGWEWRPGERPGPDDPPAADWESGIPFTV